MLDVDIEKIIPVTEARDSFNKIIDEVEGSDELYVLTKNGKPAAIIVGVHHLETLTGIKHTDIAPDLGDNMAGASAAVASQINDDSVQTTSSDNITDQPLSATDQPEPVAFNNSQSAMAPQEDAKIDLPPVAPLETGIPVASTPISTVDPDQEDAQPLGTPEWATTPQPDQTQPPIDLVADTNLNPPVETPVEPQPQMAETTPAPESSVPPMPIVESNDQMPPQDNMMPAEPPYNSNSSASFDDMSSNPGIADDSFGPLDSEEPPVQPIIPPLDTTTFDSQNNNAANQPPVANQVQNF